MSSCSTPAANTNGSFHYTSGMSWEKWAEFTIDENGYFKVKKQIEGSTIDLYVDGNSQVLRNIKLSQKDYLDLGNVYINPFPINFIIKLDVQNPYTENDTLVMSAFSSSDPLGERLIPGPFESGFLDSVVNYPYGKFPITWSATTDGNTLGYSISYLFRDETGWDGDKEIVSFDLAPICSGEFAEVTLVIE